MTTASVTALPFELGDPSSLAALTLIPLFASTEPQLSYVGLDEGIALGLHVTEVDSAGSVGALAIDNPTKTDVLVYEGEELVGAKQNRILDLSILIQAHSRLVVPVSCVERGRWSYRSAAFAAAPRAAYPELRRTKHLGGSQGEVWSSVAAKAARLDAVSPTEAAEEMYVRRGATLEQYVAALPRVHRQAGAIVCIAGRVVCLDFVGRSDVYAGLYPKLLRGYALDALEYPVDAPVPLAYVDKLLMRIARATRMPTEQVGVGQRRRLRSARLAGSELVVGDETLALTVFPLAAA